MCFLSLRLLFFARPHLSVLSAANVLHSLVSSAVSLSTTFTGLRGGRASEGELASGISGRLRVSLPSMSHSARANPDNDTTETLSSVQTTSEVSSSSAEDLLLLSP